MADRHCICTICGKQFSPLPGKKNLFCSLDCYRVAQRRGDYSRGSSLRWKCAGCGVDVIGVSRGKKRNGEPADKVFCGRDCYNTHRAKERSKSRGKCKRCGIEITREMTANQNPVYCGRDCRVADKRVPPTRCLACGCWFTPMKTHPGRKITGNSAGKTCSDDCYRRWITINEDRKKKISAAFSADKHPNWQGGGDIKYRGRRGAGWAAQREKAIQRDGFKCVRCGMSRQEHYEAHGCDLNVNHKRPFWQFNGDNQKANRLSNLESLCKKCHTEVDWQYRKENPMQMVIQW